MTFLAVENLQFAVPHDYPGFGYLWHLVEGCSFLFLEVCLSYLDVLALAHGLGDEKLAGICHVSPCFSGHEPFFFLFYGSLDPRWSWT